MSGVLPALAFSMALLLLGWGGYVLARIAGSVGRGEWFYDAGLAASVGLGEVLCGLGMVLLAREKTRAMGAVWIAVSVYGLLRYGSKALVYSSATFAHYSVIMPDWNAINLVLIAGFVTYFFAMALWWWPSPAAAIVHAPRRRIQKVSSHA